MQSLTRIWNKHWFWLSAGLISLAYTLAHLLTLDRFPVFADEAIYIRWAQLINDDWKRYLFFPLNDGKTPLFMWLVALVEPFVSNQLVGGRLISVFAGFCQLWVMLLMLRALGLKPKTQLYGMLCTAFIPFWFFHHHLALIDGLLTLWLSVVALSALRWQKERRVAWLVMAGLSWGAALLTKLPAVVAAPGIFMLFLLPDKASLKTRQRLIIQFGTAIALGSLLFVALKVSPSSRQLFTRGNQFLFPVNEVLGGKWIETLQNVPAYLLYFWQYFTPALFLTTLAGLFSKQKGRTVHIFFWAGVLFVAPIALMGRVVFARYLFPAMLFFTPAAVVSLEALFERTRQAKHTGKRLAYLVLVGLIGANALSFSFFFSSMVALMPDRTPFVSSDQQQYLLEWSSGHGVREVAGLIQKQAQHQRIAIATEGFFGTLPDGLLLYLHNQDVSNIYVEGIGVPVAGLPDFFVKRAQTFDQVWLLVNSHRLAMPLKPEQKIAEYCRPAPTAPCLQLWDVTPQVRESAVER